MPIAYPPPNSGGLLWHYTSLSAFLKILEEQKFHATLSLYLNDRTEGVRGGEIIAAAAQQLANEASDPETKNLFARLVDLFRTGSGAHSYVICFGDDGDRLDHWRSYTDRGRGVAIGVSPEPLQRLPDFRLGRVTYHAKGTVHSTLRDGILTATTGFRRGMKDDSDQAVDEARGKLRHYAGELLMDLAPLTKDFAFREEREWRLYLTARDAFRDRGKWSTLIKYRARETMLVQYIDLDFPNSWIQAVKIGPGLDRDTAWSIQNLIHRHALPDDALSISEVPFRAV